MLLKRTGVVLVVGLAALGASIGVSQISARQSTVLEYCSTGDCATAAAMYVRFAKPHDDELVAEINAIVAT